MTGVNCYVLISGYFLVDTKFSIKRVLNIYFQVLFYSIAFRLIAGSVLKLDEMKSGWMNVLLPITNREYNSSLYYTNSSLYIVFLC